MYVAPMGVTPRAAVVEMPSYRAGRTPADVGRLILPAELVRLASNESPFGPLPEVISTIQSELGQINRYPDARSAGLRRRLADLLRLPVDHITVGPGSVGLLWQLAQVFLEEDTDLVAPWPSFEGYPIVAALMGARFVGVDLDDTGTADVPGMVDAISDDTRLVVLAEPNNPTGRSIGFELVEQLAAKTAGRCVIVVDEAYVEFDPDSDLTRSIQLVREYSHVVVLRTFSKAHGLAGLRVGYAAAHPSLIDLIDRVSPPFAVSSIAQSAAIASLDALDAMAERVALVRSECDRVVAALTDLGVAVAPSSTNFVWIACDDAEERSAILERDGIITRAIPGHGLRVTVGSTEENSGFVEAYARLLDRQACSTGRHDRSPTNAEHIDQPDGGTDVGST